jgi:hypothetical protein
VDEIVVSASVSLLDGVPAALRTCAQMERAGADRAILGLPLPDRKNVLEDVVLSLT